MEPVPTIVLEEEAPPDLLMDAGADPLLGILRWLADPVLGAGEESRSLIRALIDEGRRFAQTASGRRWSALLSDSPLVTKGWLLWSFAGVDLLLKSSGPTLDSPAALLEDVLHRLVEADVESYLSDLAAFAAALAARSEP
ncbi:MAG: hypothetical protein ACJ759_17670 [Thermoanaerobaculia bacterium]